jgi:3,4-dihydroxy 2-butanone 4-phosphate synthase
VFLLISRGLKNRRGHTELATEIARLAGMSEAVVLCEMLGKGKALSKNDAVEYAKRNRFVFIEGKEISSEVSSELTGL